MGLSDYIKIEREKEWTATQLNFRLNEVADIDLPILATDDKQIGRIEGIDYDETNNMVYINIGFMDKPDLPAVKISVRELGDMLGKHPSAIAKFRANGKLYHLFQYGNATLKDKSTGKEINFTMIHFFSGRVKFEQDIGFFGKLLSKIFG